MIVINPIMSGELSNAKLTLADATAADVASGKKFYAGSKELKTGTLTAWKVVSGSGQIPLYSSATSVTLGFKPSYMGVRIPSLGSAACFGSSTSIEKNTHHATITYTNTGFTVSTDMDTGISFSYFAVGK